MACKKLRPLFFLLFLGVGYCKGSIVDVNDLFKIGDFKDIEVVVPRQGFIGSPASLTSPRVNRKVPSSPEDFLTKYVRIAILEKLKLKNGFRIVFQLDEINLDGTQVRYQKNSKGDTYHYPLFYAFLDLKPSGCKMVGKPGSFGPIPTDFYITNQKPLEEPLHGVIDATYVHGIQFPLMFTIPPASNPHEDFKDNSWMDENEDKGIVYTNAITLDAPNYKRVDSILIRKVVPSMKVKQEDKKYYSSKDKILDNTKKTDTTEVVIKQKETQLWGGANDWLWLESERTDKDGNVTMRCKKLIN